MANIKFSAFTQKVALGDVDFLVGYTGADNVRVAPSVFSGIYLPLAGGTMTGNTVNTPGTEVRFGNSNEMGLFFSSAVSNIRINSGVLAIRADDMRLSNQDRTENYITAVVNGAVDLYYDNTLMVSTVSEGVNLPDNKALFLDNTNNNNPVYFRNAGTNAATLQIGRGTTPGSNVSMEISTGGDVGIGVVPTVGLQLGNSVAGETKLAIFNSEGGGEVGLTIQSRTNRAKLRVGDNDTSAYVVAEGGISSFGPSADADTTNISVVAGNVGIGTVSPVSLLNIKAEDPTLTIESNRTTVVADEILGQIDFRTNEGSFLGAPATSARIRVDESQYAATTMSFWTSINPGDVLTQQLTIDPEGDATFAGDVHVADAKKFLCGAGNDLEIYHNATDSVIENNTGHLYITNYANDKSIKFATDDGAGGTTNYIVIDGTSEYTQFDKNARMMDNVNLQFGNSNDARIVHNGTSWTFTNGVNDADINFNCDDGAGGTATYMFLDGSQVLTRFLKGVNIDDNVKLTFGDVLTPGDLEIYHDASNSYIQDTGTGSLYIDAATNFFVRNQANGEVWIQGTDSGVSLRYQDSQKIVTTNTGIQVTGQMDIAALNTAPASAGAAGTLGEIRYTADYIYVCTATNTWKRTAIATW